MTVSPNPITAAIAALQTQRAVLGDLATDLAIQALRGQQTLPATTPHASAGLAGTETDRDTPGNAVPEPQLKLATVLFVDMVGSTTMGGLLDPEEIQSLVDGALRRLTAIVIAHQGKVLQYAGDSLLAVFGAGAAREDDAESAVHAGLAIVEEARRLAGQVKEAHGIEGFSLRVGAHTGPVLLGGGVDGQNSVRGGTVNIAARMEQTAPPGTMRISHDCWRQVRGLFEVVEQAPLMVKGIAKPLLTYLVEGTRQRSFETDRRGVDGQVTRLIGRIDESARLRGAYLARCASPDLPLQALFLVAEAGIGKTRLAAEFGHWVRQQPPGGCVLTARASERRMGQPYGFLRDLLATALPLRDSDPAPVACATWMAAMSPRLGGDADAAVLGHLLGLDFSAHDGVRGLIGEARQLRDLGWHCAREALRSFASAGPPLLLLLDDTHWADDASLDFIEDLLARHTDLHLLMVVLTRPTLLERRPDWRAMAAQPGWLDLPQLDTRYSDELAEALLARLDTVPDELREMLVCRAEGNPYFMEELVNMLIDQGTIVPGPVWQLRPNGLDSASLPGTLVGVLQARLDGLPPAQRRALQLAAVIGPVFWDDALQTVDLISAASLQPLVWRQMLVEREPSTLAGLREYGFKHHTLHQVCYDSVLKDPKRAAHARVARWLAAQSGMARLDLMAEHFERGGAADQAIDYWQRAAEQAAGRYANAAAVAHAERALALVAPDDLRRRFALRLLCAKVLRTQSERQRLALCLAELDSLSERLGQDALRSEAAERYARFHSDGGEAARALHVARQALVWAPADAPETAARAQLLIASALCTLGRSHEAQAHSQAGLATARQAGLPAVEAMLLNQQGMDATNRGDIGAAILLFEQALALHRAAQNRSNEAGTLSNMAYAAFVLGDYGAARGQFLQAAELCRQIGQRHTEGIIQVNLALVRLCEGDAAGAQDHARDALRLLRQAGSRDGQAAALRVAGHVELAQGDAAAASDSFAASRALFDELGLTHLAIEAIAGQALLLLAARDTPAALAQVETILARQAAGASLAGTDEPLRIGLVCHQVLVAAGDGRAAAVLAATFAELQDRAQQISDPARRHSFLNQVPWHRDLCQRWARRPAH